MLLTQRIIICQVWYKFIAFEILDNPTLDQAVIIKSKNCQLNTKGLVLDLKNYFAMLVIMFQSLNFEFFQNSLVQIKKYSCNYSHI